MKTVSRIMVVIRQNGKIKKCSVRMAVRCLTQKCLDSRVIRVVAKDSVERIIRHRIWSAVSRRRKASKFQSV